MTEALKLQREGMSWLFEMGILDNPNVINQLKGNILGLYPHIYDIELLSIMSPKQQVLIYLEFKKLPFWKRFNKDSKEQDCINIQEFVSDMLSTFQVKVTTDPEVFTKALEVAKRSIQ